MSHEANTEEYKDGARDTRLAQLEKTTDDLEARLGRVERIVYGAVAILGLVSYWPSIQKFLHSLGLTN